MADLQKKSYNLFDKVTAPRSYTYPALQNTIEAFGQGCSTYIKCLPNTTYTITKIVSSRFAVCYTTSEPLNGVSYRELMYNHEGTKITITTDSEAQYLYIFYYNSNYDTKTEQEIRDSIMVNSGSTALPYEPYGWVHSLRKLGTATEAVENPLYSDGTAITAYTLKGNEEHTGTPSPQNPVDVNGVGVRTENLFNTFDIVGQVPSTGNGALVSYNGSTTSFIPINSGNVLVTKPEGILIYLMLYAANGDYIGYDIANTGTTINGSNISGYENARLARLRIDRTSGLDDIQIMFNAGSTAKPYEPYGYFIEIEVS